MPELYSTINKLFEHQAQLTPHNIACVYNNIGLSYLQINQRANQLAAHLLDLQQKIDKKNKLVALCLNRNENMLIIILAVLKSGCAYVPIDPKFPVERIVHILADTKSQIVITNDEYIPLLQKSIKSNSDKNSHFFVSIDNQHISSDNIDNPNINQHTNNLAYVIYTSGTTGVPKGVMIEHGGVINLVMNQRKIFKLNQVTQNDLTVKNCLWFANYVFDAHVWDIFAPLCTGHTVHIINDEVRQELTLIANYVLEHNIYMATIPPALLDNKTLLPLKYLVVAGEKTEQKVFDFYKANNVHIINAYGPTEITVCSHYHIFQKGNGNIIGKPLDNVVAYVLDDNLDHVTENQIGELCIGGAGIARGYLNLLEPTHEKFIINPFVDSMNKYNRLYKTGDFVRLLPDGLVEYIERRDHQVKINGYRIDLGEIEAHLSKYPTIQQSVVQVQELGRSKKCLIAYYVSEEQIKNEELTEYLAKKLPTYMIPNQLIHLKKLPLTVNGKVDKAALPIANLSNYGLHPRNDIEQMICEEFANILGLEPDQVMLGSDFIQLGGNSIMAGKVTAKLNTYFDSNLQIAEVLNIRKVGHIYDAIILKKNKYNCLIKLNWISTNKPILFMIHDGLGGCELYTSLANKLNTSFSCYGVDNYNLYHDEKINQLDALANVYLQHIITVMHDNKQDHCYLFGVCLGGIIAAQMALLLEERGINITLICWDSMITDEEIATIRKKNTIQDIKSVLIDTYQGLDKAFINKVLQAVPVNNKLLNTIFKQKLTNTQIILFKALKVEDKIDIFIPEYQYTCSLTYNNFDLIQNDLNKIIKFELIDVKHGDFLEQTDMIAQEIKQCIKIGELV